jgi:hypothetical protein
LPTGNIPSFEADPSSGIAGVDADIWKVYVSEATDFDKSLVASWNEDLDVLLIFVCPSFSRGF